MRLPFFIGTVYVNSGVPILWINPLTVYLSRLVNSFYVKQFDVDYSLNSYFCWYICLPNLPFLVLNGFGQVQYGNL